MDICWEKKGDFTRPARLVAVYNSDKKHWVRLMTNLNREDFSLDDIQVVYRLRWQSGERIFAILLSAWIGGGMTARHQRLGVRIGFGAAQLKQLDLVQSFHRAV